MDRNDMIRAFMRKADRECDKRIKDKDYAVNGYLYLKEKIKSCEEKYSTLLMLNSPHEMREEVYKQRDDYINQVKSKLDRTLDEASSTNSLLIESISLATMDELKDCEYQSQEWLNAEINELKKKIDTVDECLPTFEQALIICSKVIPREEDYSRGIIDNLVEILEQKKIYSDKLSQKIILKNSLTTL